MDAGRKTWVGGLIMIVFLASVPVNAEEEASPRVIGSYTHILGSSDLTEDHIAEVDGDLVLTPPSLATSTDVQVSYLDERLPGWASDKQFDFVDGRAVFEAGDVVFSPFIPDELPQFTFGSRESIVLTERPMWVSVDRAAAQIMLKLDDGNTAGQDVRVAKEWLWREGMHRPVVTHEDGLEVEVVSGDITSRFFTLEVPHFSTVILTPDDISIKKEKGGSFEAYLGTVVWDDVAKRLEVDAPDRKSVV